MTSALGTCMFPSSPDGIRVKIRLVGLVFTNYLWRIDPRINISLKILPNHTLHRPIYLIHEGCFIGFHHILVQINHALYQEGKQLKDGKFGNTDLS